MKKQTTLLSAGVGVCLILFTILSSFQYNTVTIQAAPHAWEQIIRPLGSGFEYTGLGGWVKIATQNTVSCSQDSANVIYTQTRTPGNTNDVDWAKWRPTIPSTGEYQVYVYIPDYTHTRNVTAQARYKIYHASGNTTRTIDQDQNKCGWVSLGQYQFNAGTSGYVYMGDYTGDDPIRLIAADGVKFVQVSTPPPTTPPPTTPPPGNFDLAIDHLEVTNTSNGSVINPGDSVPDGTTITFRVYIKNNGSTDITQDFTVKYYDNGSFVDDDTETSTVKANGAELEYEDDSFSLNGIGQHTLRVDLDTADVIDETNENNNDATFVINVVQPVQNGDVGGQVTNITTGIGLSGASVTLGEHTISTDANGYYLFTNISAGTYSLSVTKNGYISYQSSVTVIANSSVQKNVALTPQSPVNNIVSAARAQIGVPYSTQRQVYCGSWGPWDATHTVCTDLAIDAYLIGTGGSGCGGSCGDDVFGAMRCNNGGVNLEALLYQDHRAHPGRYIWGSARNAEDMRRYFAYNQTYLDRNTSWQAGDVVFFDWGSLGAEHVGVIVAVNNGLPTRIVQSSGSGSRFPECRQGACEVNWDSDFQNITRAHGRIANVSNTYGSSTTTETLKSLRIALYGNSGSLLTLYAPEGRWINKTRDLSLVASNNDEFIPYIPYGDITWMDTTQVITIYHPLLDIYRIVVTDTVNANLNLEVTALEDGQVQQVQYYSHTVIANAPWVTVIDVNDLDQKIGFDTIANTITETLSLPSSLLLTVPAFGSYQKTFVISTTSNYSISIELSTLYSQMGELYPVQNITVTPFLYNSSQSSPRLVMLSADYSNQIWGGQYLGTIKITLTNESGSSIYRVPLQVNHVAVNRIYLPVIIRKTG